MSQTATSKKLIDPGLVRKAIHTLIQPGQVFEVRALEASTELPSRYTDTLAGYFDNIDDLLKAISKIRSAVGVYITLQECDPDLLHRAYNKIVKQKKGYSTADKDIRRYHWLPIDCDPERLPQISSTDEEHEQALAHARYIRAQLREMGWPEPIEGDSGNGGHLLYAIDLQPEDKQLIQRVIEGLAERFDIPGIHIDRTVYNPARIWKLYGTLAGKGDDTLRRPHRMSRLIDVPEELHTVSRELLEASAAPEHTTTTIPPGQSATQTGATFDLEMWLSRHGIGYTGPEAYEGGKRYILESCVFDPSHTGTSAAIIQLRSGALVYKCQHASCYGRTWQEVRIKFEPAAYQWKEQTQAYKPSIHTANNGNGNLAGDAPETAIAPRPFNHTDLGNAERFASQYRDRVRWCQVWNCWLVFNGKAWEQDKTGQVDRLGKATVRSIYLEAAGEIDDEKRKQIVKHAVASESNRAVRAMLDRAKSELPATPGEFNSHLHLLNCQNGTLDLRTGELRPHTPADMLTRCLKINYNPLVPCPRWLQFVHSIFAGEQSLIDFLQQAMGMSLSGDISEQCLFICHGGGSNGKTTLLEAVRILLASYGLAANIETFQMRKGEHINNDVAELYGARFVTADENAPGSRLNEAFIKKATGKQPLRARRLHENEFEFMPEFTIWFAVNHKPVVKDTTKGMWRRVHFIPFSVTIEGDQVDKHLGEKLLEEAEGILAWLVQGCIAWYRQGRLNAPQIVQEATQAYRAEMDTIARFLDEECELGAGKKVSSKMLLARYESWCDQNGERYDAKHLRSALQERGLSSNKADKGFYYWFGIELKEGEPPSESPKQLGGVGGVGGVKNDNFTRRSETSQNYLILGQPTPPTPPSKDEEKERRKKRGRILAANPQQAGETKEAYTARIEALLREVSV